MRSCSGALGEAVLDVDRGVERLVHAREGGKETVARGLEDAAAMAIDRGPDDLVERRAQSL